MLKLLSTVKFGFEDEFVTIKEMAIDISFLTNKQFYKKIYDLGIITYDYMTADELLKKYVDSPGSIVEDYAIANIITSTIRTTIIATHFPEMLYDKFMNALFPELFVIRDLKLINDDNSEIELSQDTSDFLLEQILDYVGLDNIKQDDAVIGEA